jgi:hypothetical protein
MPSRTRLGPLRLATLTAVLAAGTVAWEYLLYTRLLSDLAGGAADTLPHLALDAALVLPVALVALVAGLAWTRRLGRTPRGWPVGTAALVSLVFVALTALTVPLRDLGHDVLGARWLEEDAAAADADREAGALCSFTALRRLAGAGDAGVEGLARLGAVAGYAVRHALMAQTAMLPLLVLALLVLARPPLAWSVAALPARRRRRLARAARLVGTGGLVALGVTWLGANGHVSNAQVGNACTGGGAARTYNVSAIRVDMPLNRFGDHVPGSYMYVLDENIASVRTQETAPFPDRVSHGLRKDPIQPLVIRANLGECLVINFTNRLTDGPASMHIHGLPHSVQNYGGRVGLNPSTFAGPGQSITYRVPVPLDATAERAYYFHDHGASRDRISLGLFGAVVAEPAGSQHLDPETGLPLAGSNWEAIIADPNGPDFREFVIVYHEIGNEDFRGILDAGGRELPLQDELADVYRPASRALNYRSEPFRNRLALHDDKSQGYGSYAFGDPATPIPRSYLGEPTKTRLLHGGSEMFHVHHLHGGGDRWRRNPRTEPEEFAADPPLQKRPTQDAFSTRLDSQSLGPSESFNLEHECGAGGCQQAAGDFLYHCHIGHHYVGGMWAFWRVFDTSQEDLAFLPEEDPRPDAVNSLGLVGLEVEGKVLVPRTLLTNPATERALEDFVEAQLPPQGVPIDSEDATVWDWLRVDTSAGPLYLGEPEDTAVWANFRSDTPGERPEILFNPENGRYAWPLLRPHLGQRPPFSPNGHSGAPWLGENGSALRPDGLCPNQEVVSSSGRRTRHYPVTAIELPIRVTPTSVDNEGLVFVLSEDKAAVRSGAMPAQPLALRSNVGDCVNIVFTSELDDDHDTQGGHSKVNMHTHFVQFDPQASDGVITGFSYEQSVRPYATENRRLVLAAPVGASTIVVNQVSRLRPGIWIGIGLGRGTCGTAPDGEPLPCTEIRRIVQIAGNTITLDRPLVNAHAIGTAVGVEFAQYRWYSDVDSGTVFWHDHVNFKTWNHGLFGAHIIEPEGSTYHDPRTGAAVRSGTIVDVHAPGGSCVGEDVCGSFREFMYFVHRQTPDTPAPALATVNLRAEPLLLAPDPLQAAIVRTEPRFWFSSIRHGDPITPIPRAYVGDPFVVRGMSVTEMMGGLRITGHRFSLGRFNDVSAPHEGTSVGISERQDLLLEGGAGGPAGMPGDYLYMHAFGREVLSGAWGILRVHDTARGDLMALPGRAPSGGSGFPQLTVTGQDPPEASDPGDPCPSGAPVRSYDVAIFNVPIVYSNDIDNIDPAGVVFALRADEADIAAGRRRPEPLVLRVNAGECLEIDLRNDLDQAPNLLVLGQPASVNLSKLLFDPQGSYGAAVGFNPDSTVAAGDRRLYRFYADKELGVATLLSLANPELAKRGAFGAVIVEPEDADYTDPLDGSTLDAGVFADVHTRDGSFREYVALFQDEDERIGDSAMPYKVDVEGQTGINYVRHPREERRGGRDLFFDSRAFGDPRTLAQAFPGDRFRFHVAQAWGEQPHVFSVDGHRWPLEPFMPGAEQVSAKSLVPGEAFTADLTGGAGAGQGNVGDHLFQDHRMPFQEAGLWGLLRVHSPTAPGVALEPLPADPFCGDNIRNRSEECDGIDSAECPGACLADCRCPPPGATLEADVSVRASDPNRNFGRSTALEVDGSSAKHTFLRFRVTGVRGRTVTSARLRLRVAGASDAASDSGGRAHRIAACGWDELTTTWNTRPPIDGAVLSTLGPVRPNDTVELDVTAAIPGDGVFCLALDSLSSDGVDYNSREAAVGQPQLLIDVGGAPGTTTTTSSTTSTTAATAPTTTTSTTTSTTLVGGAVATEILADVRVEASSAGTNFGASSTLAADADSAKQTFLRVRVTGVAGRTVTSARLRLRVASDSRAASDSGGRVHAITACAWDELTTTWNARPPIDGPVLSTVGAVASNGTVEFDVTPAIPGDGIFCLALDSLSSDGVDYNAREAAAGRPELLVTVAGAPGSTTTTTLASSTTTAPPPSVTTTSTTTSTTVAGGAIVTEVLADVRTEASNPTTNFGTSTSLSADHDSEKNTFLRVRVTGIGAGPVTRALLRLTVPDVSRAESDSGGRIRRISDCAWVETAVTFDTQPALDGVPGPALGPVARDATVEFDVTSHVTADGTYCFAVTSDSSDGVDYNSREAATNRPQFVVEVGP